MQAGPSTTSALSARRVAVLRLMRAFAMPLALALPPMFWVADATRRASFTTLGRDQGIFQYVAWAISQGDRDYLDVRDVNGPVTHMIHRLLLALGGGDEHRFRTLDLLITGLTYFVTGALLPGLRSRQRPDLFERAAWGIAAWVVLSGQYLLYGFWDLAQRESFFDWFLLPAVALQLFAQSPHRDPLSARRRSALFVAVGALSAVPVLGKPTYALFTVVQLLGLLGDASVRRWRFVLSFAAGCLAGALVPLAWLAVEGDVGAYLHIQLVDVPAMYRFIWPRAPAEIFSNAWCATQAIFAITGAVVLLSLVLVGEMPARTLVPALVPVAALGSVVAQQKGFPYHFHPVTAGVHLQWLVFASWLVERCRVSRRDRALVRLAPLAVCVVFALRVATSMEDSPHIRATWLLRGADSPADRLTRQYFDHFPESDFFPYEMRRVATYLREHTAPNDRVQTYGMDPYVLFLAGRLSATPYIYLYDLNADAALAGGTGGVPDEEQQARIRAIRQEHEVDLLARLEAHPPAAFVFFDGAPLISMNDAWSDFEEHCPTAAEWVQSRYREAVHFEHDHVWLRDDLAPEPDARPDPDP